MKHPSRIIGFKDHDSEFGFVLTNSDTSFAGIVAAQTPENTTEVSVMVVPKTTLFLDHIVKEKIQSIDNELINYDPNQSLKIVLQEGWKLEQLNVEYNKKTNSITVWID